MDVHRDELMANWAKCQMGDIPDKIEPLKWFFNFKVTL